MFRGGGGGWGNLFSHKGKPTPNIALISSNCKDVEYFLPLMGLFHQSDLINFVQIWLYILFVI